jgi:hypothetical protein
MMQELEAASASRKQKKAECDVIPTAAGNIK